MPFCFFLNKFWHLNFIHFYDSLLMSMAYEVTATRRRPQRFEDLIGQEFVAATLKNSIQTKKIAHAYLFSGPRGCGKTSTARIFAKALNCEKGPTPTPCGECAACREITKGSSLDVIEIDGASNTSVNDVRQIKDEVRFPPNSCRYKIYIIDEVHMLSTSAFNALLKTIEEPPEYVIFIFATTELQKVPATIKSRCQQFNFRLVPVDKIKEQLSLAAKEINIEADDEALNWIAREATGSMRDSYTLFDQVAAFSENHITYEKIRDKLGLVGTDRLNALFEECAASNPSAAEEKLNEFLQFGISIEQLITNSADYLRSLLLIKNGIRKGELLGQDASRFSEKVLSSWNSVQIERALSLFLQLYRDVRYSLNPRYELDLAFSRLCWLKEYASPAEVKAAVSQARALLDTAPHPPAGTGIQETRQSFSNGAEMEQSGAPKEFHFAPLTPSEPPVVQRVQPVQSVPQVVPSAPAASVDSDDIQSKLINSLMLEDEVLASLLKNTRGWKIEDGKITAVIGDAFQKSRIDEKINSIGRHIEKTLGKNFPFEVRVIQQEPVRAEKVQVPEIVSSVVKIFKGTIVGGKAAG